MAQWTWEALVGLTGQGFRACGYYEACLLVDGRRAAWYRASGDRSQRLGI